MWWVLGYSANYIIGNYFQNQFSDVDPDAKLGAAAIGMEACRCVLWPCAVTVCCDRVL